MLSVKALGHVGLYCTNLQKSNDFYTKILGSSGSSVGMELATRRRVCP